MHLLILCEGELEKRVLKVFLRPYWEKRFKTVEVQHYSGNGELKEKFKGDTETQLAQEPDSCVLCLVDLYREPFGVYDKLKMSPAQGFQTIQAHMIKQIASRYHSRFGAFPVVMELETWLFGDATVLSRIGLPITHPESVFHPTAALEEGYKEKNQSYGKITQGASLFREADARRVYADTCPHFNLLADWLTTPSPKTVSPKSQAYLDWEQKLSQAYNYFEALNRSEETSEESLDLVLQAWAVYEDLLQSPSA